MKGLERLGFTKTDLQNGTRYTTHYRGCLVKFMNGTMKVTRGKRELEETGIRDLTLRHVERATEAINA